MKTLVKLQYFKPGGKYYSSGEYETYREHFHEVVQEVRQFIVEGLLPGLVEGCREFTVLLEAVEPWGVPHLFPAPNESRKPLVPVDPWGALPFPPGDEAASARLERVKSHISELDLGVLRAMCNNWRSVETVTLCGAQSVADQFLRALDALDVVFETEERGRQADEALEKVFGAPPRKR